MIYTGTGRNIIIREYWIGGAIRSWFTLVQVVILLLENTEGAIKDGQSRDTGYIGHKTPNEDKQNKNKTQKTNKASNTNPTENENKQHRKITKMSKTDPIKSL